MNDSGRLYMKEFHNKHDEDCNRYHIGIDAFNGEKNRNYVFTVINAQSYQNSFNKNPGIHISTSFSVADDDKFNPLSIKSYMTLSHALKYKGMKFNKKTGTLIYKNEKGG